MKETSRTHLFRIAAITVVFTYMLVVGGTLNGLALPSAVTMSLVILALIGAAWLGWAWYRGRPIAFSPVTGAWTVYLAAYAVAAVFSLDPRRSLNALALTALYALVWVLVSDLIDKGWPAELFPSVMRIVGSMVIFLALWQAARYELDWLAVRGDGPVIPPIILRPNPLLTHANQVAAFLNMLWPFALIQALSSPSWPRRIAGACWVVLAGVVILLTSSRGAWLGAAAALPVTGILWWLSARNHDRQRTIPLPRPRLSVGWFAAGASVVALVTGLSVIVQRLLDNPTHGSGFSSRRAFWQAAWRSFTSHPLTGLGPDTYATAYFQEVSVPPRGLYDCAHSQPMNVLAEAGALGLVAGGGLLAAIAWTGWRRWQEGSPPQRRLLASVGGALAATTVHSLFDSPPTVPLNGIVVAALAAILTSRPKSVHGHIHPTLSRLMATLLLVGLLTFGAWSQAAYEPYQEGIQRAGSGDWHAALSPLEKAVVRDPGHAFYSLASGYAHGVVAAEGDTGALATAVARYEEAINLEPGYALNHANVSALYWQQGHRKAAIAAAQQAAQAAPREGTFWLNLGFYREQMGDVTGAHEAYAHTLDLRPSWASAYYWRATDLRRFSLETWRSDREAQDLPTARDSVRVMLDTGRFHEALEVINQALNDNPQWGGGYAGRARALLELGQVREAADQARLAAFLQGLDPTAGPEADWVLANDAYRQGNLASAINLAERALDGYRYQSIAGPGTYGRSHYGWAVFRRLAFRPDLLPQLVTIRFTDRQIRWLETLGSWYEEAGAFDDARATYQQALAAAPDATLAAERLAALGDE